MLTLSHKRFGLPWMMVLAFLLSMIMQSTSWAQETKGCDRGNTFQNAKTLAQTQGALACALDGRKLLIVGDYHGSNEIPDFVGQLLKKLTEHRPVKLGLEIEPFEAGPIRTYVQSAGHASDKRKLLHDGYWSALEGRNSAAMVRLIETVQALRQAGRNVEIFTMVPAYTNAADVQKAGGVTAFWNRGLANAIQKQLMGLPDNGIVVAFMGEDHAVYRNQPGNPDRSTTALLLKDSPYVLDFKVHGEASSCTTKGCGLHPVDAPDAPPMKGKLTALGKTGPLNRAWVKLPTLTPSPVAKPKSQTNP